MPRSPLLNPKPPSLLRVSESQAISNSSSFISSTSTSSLFDRISDASSGCLTDPSSPFTPSTAEFGNTEEVGVTQPSESTTKKQASPAGERGRHDHALFSPQSRIPRRTNVSPVNRSTRLDRACALGSRSSSRSYSQNGTPFLSLIPISATMNEDRRYHFNSEDSFDAITILRNRLERGIPTVATRRALEIMDPDGHPSAACVNENIGGAVAAPITVVVTAPDSPVEDWSSDFDLGSATDVKICPSPPDDNTTVDQLSNSESSPNEDWLNALEIAAAHSSILFPSVSDQSLLDKIEQDTVSSPMLSESFLELPSKPVLEPVTSDSPCSPFFLGTPDLSSNWENSYSSLSTLMAESTPSPISSPENMSVDEEEMARIMRTVLSIPTRSRVPFSGSPHGDVDPTTVMHLAIASTFPADPAHPHASHTRTLIGLGVAMPAIHPPLPPTLFPLHHPPGTTLSSLSLRDLGYQSFDDKMFEIEQASFAFLSRNVNRFSMPENIETDLGFELNESPLYSPLEGCPAPALPLPEVDSECSDASRVEQALTITHNKPLLDHASPIIFGKLVVGLGVGGPTEASVGSQPPPLPTESSPTTGRDHLVSADESVIEEVATLPVSDFYAQIQNSAIFEPLGVQKSIELDASQLERQSALYNLEHTDLLLEHMLSYSPPIQIEKRTEIERQFLAGLSHKKKESPESRLFRIPLFSSPALSVRQDYNDPRTPTTNKLVGDEQRSVNQPAVSDEPGIFSKRSYQALKKLGLERLAIFQPHSGRDDLVLTSPTITPQDDPRSPYQSTLKRVFLSFSSINPPSEMHSPMKRASTSTGFDTKQSPVTKLVNHPESVRPSKLMGIGLGLPAEVVALRRSRLQVTSSQDSIVAVQSHSRRFSQECQNPSLIVTEPSIASSCSRVQSAESSNQFLKPSHFVQRSLYDIVEVPTPPSSTSSSPRGTPSLRNHQWSSPFSRLNPPQKGRSPKSQLSTPSTGSGSPLVEKTTHAETEAVAIKVVVPPLEAPISSTASARPGFKGFVSKFTSNIFKRSQSKTSKLNLALSPGLIEHADAKPGLGILQLNNRGTSCGTRENQLRVLF